MENELSTISEIERLPREILEAIFSYLELEQLYKVQFVNKRWRFISVDHYLKKRKCNWQWSATKKDSSIDLSLDKYVVLRPTNEGKNPGIFASLPLTRKHSHFRVQIIKLAKWFGVGIADNRYETHGKTLGTQSLGVNSAYFWQDNGISRLQMFGEENIDAGQITQGSNIDVKVDFSTKQVSYWLNNRYQGTLTCSKFSFAEGQLFPCVNLSSGTVLSLRNDDFPSLDPTIEEEECDEEHFEMPDAPFPTNWRWDDSSKKKANVIELDVDKLSATRNSGGHNPAVMTQTPFTRNSWYIQFQIIRCSKWLGIGLADRRLRLNGSRTLGNQRKGFNASYFWQQNRSHNLQTYGEKSKSVSPFQDNDIIGIRVDFDEQSVSYYRNGVLEGTVLASRRKMEEGKVYPCIDLSVGAEVAIRNVDHYPNSDLNNFRK